MNHLLGEKTTHVFGVLAFAALNILRVLVQPFTDCDALLGFPNVPLVDTLLLADALFLLAFFLLAISITALHSFVTALDRPYYDS